jgi:hypothetical protein
MKFKVGDIVVHLASERKYVIVGCPDKYRIESNNQLAYVYHFIEGDWHWVRSQSEMEDGRFIKVDRVDNQLTLEGI